jgi:hypothetical protein
MFQGVSRFQSKPEDFPAPKPETLKRNFNHERRLKKIDGLDGCPYLPGDGGSLRRIEVAGSADSCCSIGLVQRHAQV